MSPRDPTPEEIHLACLAIQSTWTAAERMKRLRVDLRPSFVRCDGELMTMDADVYEGHHDARAELLAGPPPSAGNLGSSGF